MLVVMFTIAITVLGMVVILIPPAYLDGAAIASVASLGLALLLFLWPWVQLFSAGTRIDAVTLSSLGPTAGGGFFSILLSIAAVLFALNDYPALGYALALVSIGIVVFSALAMKATSAKLATASAIKDVPSSHVVWAAEVDVLCASVAKAEIRQMLERLREDLRYVANDLPGFDALTAEIEISLAGLKTEASAGRVSGVSAKISEVASLLRQRESALRRARSET
ncbi:MAG: hypothetical protein ACKOBM_03420 [Gammaproteobacteria bacterium]